MTLQPEPELQTRMGGLLRLPPLRYIPPDPPTIRPSDPPVLSAFAFPRSLAPSPWPRPETHTATGPRRSSRVPGGEVGLVWAEVGLVWAEVGWVWAEVGLVWAEVG